MAALIVRQAAEARLQSQALRAESEALRFSARVKLAALHERSRRGAAIADASRRTRGSLLAPSPWSSLEWRRDEEALQTVLVAL